MARRCSPKPCGMSQGLLNPFFQNGAPWMGSGVSLDPDISDFDARVTAASGALQPGDTDLLSTFKTTLVTDGIWDKIKDCGFFLGGFNGSKVKLKYAAAGLENLVFTNFVSGDYVESSGLKATTTNRKIATGVLPTSHGLSNTNFSVGYFMTEPDPSTNYFYVTDTKVSGAAGIILGNNQSSFGTSGNKLNSRTDVPMWHCYSCTTDRMHNIRDYQNSYAPPPNAVVPSAVTLDTEIAIFGCRNNGTNLFSVGRIAFYFIGEYLTLTEIDTLHNAVKDFLIAKGRYAETNELITFGDSITYQSSATVYTTRWSRLVAVDFGLRERNEGISGSRLRTSSSAAPGGFDRRDELLKYNINSNTEVILQYGVNDVLADSGDGTPASVSDFTSKLVTICGDLISAGVLPGKIRIGSPSFLAGAVSAARQELWAAGARAAAVTAAVKYVDVYAYMRDNGGVALLDVDNVHPVNAGHTAMAFCHTDLADFVS